MHEALLILEKLGVHPENLTSVYPPTTQVHHEREAHLQLGTKEARGGGDERDVQGPHKVVRLLQHLLYFIFLSCFVTPLYLRQSFPSFSFYIPLSPLIQYSAYHYRYTERTSFTVHPDNEMWTLARQTGFYEIDLMFGVDQVIHQTIMRPK